MTLRSYLTIMLIMTMLCWAAWTYVIWTVNPEITNWVGFVLFYISLLCSLIGTASILGFIVRFIGLRQDLAWRSAKEAFRQSFLFSSFIVIILMLLSKGLFTWLNLIFLVVGLSVLEFFLISYEK